MYKTSSLHDCILTVKLFVLIPYLLAVQTKATSCEWVQSSTPIVLARQSVSLLSVPLQRSSSSHIGKSDEISLKLFNKVILES